MKTIIMILSLFVCVSLHAQDGKLFLSNWHKDGNGEMMVPSDGYTYFKKGKLYYYISNDNSNIYIDMKFDDPGIQSRILKQGITIWVNMDSKLSKKMGVRFPIGSQFSGGRNKAGGTDNTINPDGSPVTPLSLADKIELIGFISEVERRFPAENADNFRGSVKYDNGGVLHYKMVMPITKLPVRNSKDGNGAMPFTFGIEYGALPQMNASRVSDTPPPSVGSPSGGRRGGSSGGGRSGGGGQGGGNPRANNDSSQNQVPPVLLWIKNIKLATAR